MEGIAVCADGLLKPRRMAFISDALRRLILKAGLASWYGVLVVIGCSMSIGVAERPLYGVCSCVVEWRAAIWVWVWRWLWTVREVAPFVP